MMKTTHRTLLVAATLLGSVIPAPAQGREPQDPAPANDSLRVLPAGALTPMTHDYLTRIAKRYWDEVRPARLASLDTPEEVERHGEWVRSKVLERIGGLPEAGPSLNVRVTRTLRREGYEVDNLIYESQANFHVTASLYRPTTGTGPFPTIVGIPGHGAFGRANPANYQRVWIALAKHGFNVLTIDPFGQGERMEHWDPVNDRPIDQSDGTGEHTIAGTKMYLTGTNPARWMVFDAMRGIDYLLTRPDVDRSRIAVIGSSGGGAHTNWLSLLDGRHAAAGPVSGVNSYETMWEGQLGLNDAEQNLFALVSDGLEHTDMYARFAPKPLRIFAATRDHNPIQGTRDSYRELKRHIYGTLGRPERVEMFEYDDQHGWSKPRREETVKWLARVLQNRIVDYVEPEPFDTIPPQDLRATPSGQVFDTGGPGGETTHTLNHAIARRLHADRTALGTRDLPGLVRKRLEMGSWSGLPAVRSHGALGGDGYRIEKLSLETEEGITVPALAFVPSGAPGRRPAVLYLNDQGKTLDAGVEGPIARLARSGRVVLAIDARQWGESAYPRCQGHRCRNHKIAVKALMLGKSLVGLQTRDALRSLDYLASRPDVNAREIVVVGRGNAGVHAMYVALLDGRVKRVNVSGAPASYLELTNTKVPGEVMDIVINRVLADFDLPDVERALGARLTRSAGAPDYARWLDAR